MLFLITNDDGVDCEGIRVLEDEAKKFADVIVVTPLIEMSGASHAITIMNPLRIIKKDDNHFVINGTPADCVYLGIYHILKKKPDFVFSGINKGPNLGFDVFYSGTVGACIEALIQGIPSVAFSLAGKNKFPFNDARIYIKMIIEKTLKNGLRQGTMLNVNIPVVENSQIKIKGIKITKLGMRFFRDQIVERSDPRGDKYIWIGGSRRNINSNKGSDSEAILNNFVSITPIKIDITSFEDMEKLDEFEKIT